MGARGDDRSCRSSWRTPGRGIPPDKLDTIFEPFVQVDRHVDTVESPGRWARSRDQPRPRARNGWGYRGGEPGGHRARRSRCRCPGLRPEMNRYDAVIVGGSFAGLGAALQLARARRRVLVVDAGRPRNRFARTSHGFLGQDGRPPGLILDEARKQVLAYPTAEYRSGEAVAARVRDEAIELHTGIGRDPDGTPPHPRDRCRRRAPRAARTAGAMGRHRAALSVLPRLRSRGPAARRARDERAVHASGPAHPGLERRRHAVHQWRPLPRRGPAGRARLARRACRGAAGCRAGGRRPEPRRR